LQEHQTQDWKRHKRLCSYLSTAAEEVGAETFFGREFRFVDTDENVAGNDVDAENVDDVEKEFEKLDLKKESEETEKDSKSEKDQEETELVEEEDKAASWTAWTKFRVNAVKMCEILMNRKLQEWEKVILLNKSWLYFSIVNFLWLL